ncbi:MAG: hypothetical protein CSB55_03870 [Candidatus Cloacimonadota bacterium]|nr:MAG: hypothetical protein CSB55_03870 [Candidatus Cloacimonadota bacterium]
MKKIWIFLIASVLVISACERYDHVTYSDSKIENLFLEMSNDLYEITPEKVENFVKTYYDSAYLNTGINYDLMYVSYENMAADTFKYRIYVEDYDRTGKVSYYLKKFTAEGSEAGVPEHFNDVIMISGETRKFYGNQLSVVPADPNNRVAFIQFFTATTCGNCPMMSAVIEQIKSVYGDQLIFADYIFDADPGNAYMNEAIYYQAASQPATVISGEGPIIGAGNNKIREYWDKVAKITSEPAEIRFEATAKFTGNNLKVEVTTEDDASVNLENLKMRMVLTIPHPGIEYHVNGQEMHNQVIGAWETSVQNLGNINYDIELSDTDIPDDAELVVLFQTKELDLNPDNNKVHNAVKITVEK